MGTLCVAVDILPGRPFYPVSLKSSLRSYQKGRTTLNFSLSLSFYSELAITLQPVKQRLTARRWWVRGSAADYDVDMVKNRDGVYTSKKKKVVVLWDLDNKPPRGPPYPAAMELKKLAEKFGEVVDMSAYANRHAFIHLPMWVVEERRERKQLEILERKGLVTPPEAYVCKVCGRKCKTSLDLKKHFKQLHERERQKKVNRMRSLKGKKRQRYKERFISGNHKYNEAARELLTPKMGYGLAAELRRAGVYVKTVEDKPQAADWAVKRQMQHSMSSGIDWLFLVSDDSDFSEMLRKAREDKLGTVVVGDWDRALGRQADIWVPWAGVESGEVTGKDFDPKSRRSRQEDFERDDGSFSVTYFDDGRDFNGLADELVVGRCEFNGTRISAFSEGEEEEEEEKEEDEDPDYVFWDSEDEEDGRFFTL